MDTRINMPPHDLVEKAMNDPVVALELWQDHFSNYAICHAYYEKFIKTFPEDAEALARDKYCSKISELQNPRAIVSYTTRIIRDTYNKIHINEKKELKREISFEDVNAEIEFSSHSMNPEELLLTKETLKNRKEVFRISKEKIKNLKEEHREILNLMYIEEKSVAEITELLGLKKGTVYKRAAKALSELFKSLHRELINNPYFENIVRSGFGEDGIKKLQGK